MSDVDKRKFTRYAVSAEILVDGGTCLLKDISTGGCCIKCPLNVPELVIGREYKIVLTPEAESQVKPFDLTIEPCWTQDDNAFHEVGCFIVGFPGEYQSFANYLAWRAAQE
jgi:hypothetical protein